jgi:peptide chain release factor 1
MVEGEGAKQAFANEPGGHRFQRVPDNDRHGRTHTSTITVAVLGAGKTEIPRVNERDIEVTTCRGSGNGGQKKNKTDSAVQMTHKPTGLSIRCEANRSQHQNREMALRWIEAKIAENITSKSTSDENNMRRQHIGTGQRGDKVRTVRYQDGIVTNNLNGKKTTLDRYLDGDFSKLL